MTRQELIQLRDAIDVTLALPDSLRALLAQWLAPETAKPNGRDPNPPGPAPAKATPDNALSKRTAELRLLEAMRASPGSSVSGPAKAAAANRASTRERLQQLAARGKVEKDAGGLWRLKAEEPEARPTSPSSAAS